MTRFFDRGDFFGQEILVLHRRNGMMYPHHRAHLVHAVAASIHNHITVDIAVFGVHGPRIIFVLGQPGDRRVAINFRPRLARAAGQGLTQLRRVDVTIHRIPKATDQVVSGNQGVTAGAFLCVNDLKFHIHSTRHGRKVAISLHLRFGIGKAYAPITMVIIDRILWVFCQLFVERDGMGL